ncbi:MAG TPA: response regulator [Candidatus Krumholzibacterium sp.]|nr:response regulator [Candidatus Krumholzibacterium sp.]
MEDESLMGWSMANALGKAGFQCDVTGHTETALRKITDECYDLVISEYWLPGMKGIDFAGRVKQVNHSTPVVIISAGEDVGEGGMAGDERVDVVLEKPFNMDEMVALAREVLGTVPPERTIRKDR